jgi:hypothetical protein
MKHSAMNADPATNYLVFRSAAHRPLRERQGLGRRQHERRLENHFPANKGSNISGNKTPIQ